MPLRLAIVIGSTRPGRKGPAVARWVEQVARTDDRFEVTLVDLAEIGLPLLDEPAHPRLQQYEHEPTRRWSATVAAADAFLFVTPEYDFFPPAALVNAVQALLREWAYKAAGVVSYGGVSGGLRSAQGLRALLGNVNVHALPQVVPVPAFTQHLDEAGAFHPTEPMTRGLTDLLGELHKWAGALRTLRPEHEPTAAWQTRAA